jgi:hypothetical protein
MPVATAVALVFFPRQSCQRLFSDNLFDRHLQRTGRPGTMQATSVQIFGLNDLRTFVQERLCRQNELETGAFHFTERALEKRGVPCGISFCLHGPRNVKLIAIWETGRNTIVFYGSDGARVERVQLAPGPDQLRQEARRGFG